MMFNYNDYVMLLRMMTIVVTPMMVMAMVIMSTIRVIDTTFSDLNYDKQIS